MRLISRLRMRALLRNVPRAIDCAGEAARSVGFDDRTIHQIQVAVDEACANVVEHAYAGLKPGMMEITCCSDAQCLEIRVHDWGRAFRPDQVKDPDVSAALEDRSPGGLGLFLIRHLMDQAQFTFDPEAGNELLMVKRLQLAEPAGPG